MFEVSTLLGSLKVSLDDDLVDVPREVGIPFLPGAVKLSEPTQPIGVRVHLALFGNGIHAAITLPMPLGRYALLHVDFFRVPLDLGGSDAGRPTLGNGVSQGFP